MHNTGERAEGQIIVKSTGTFVQADEQGAYHVFRFSVTVRDEGLDYELQKRFTEFLEFHEKLGKENPKLKKVLPKLPTKGRLNEVVARVVFLRPYTFVSEDFLRVRTYDLEQYLKTLTSNPTIMNTHEFARFFQLSGEGCEDQLVSGPTRRGSAGARTLRDV